MITCGIMISPIDCEFQNLLLPCSGFHLMTPTPNQLPKTGPQFSFPIYGDSDSRLTLSAVCPILVKDSIIHPEVKFLPSLHPT